ncbi:VCBS domain-containing protein, partial [Mesorhizobium loti]
WGTATAMLNGGAVNLTDYGTLTQNANGTWSFVLDNSKPATQALADGNTINVSLGYTLTDKDSDTDSKTITFTINGTNDTPTITGDTTGAVIEAGNADPGAVIAGTTSTDPGALTAGTPTVSGTLTAHDPDAGATATWSGNAAGTYGSFAVNATTGVWTYTLDNSKPATNALAEGASATETFTVTVTDDKGATSTQDVTVTITGANDSPVISYAAGNAAGGVTEDGTLTTGGQLASADPDTGHTAAWSISPNSPQGTGTAYGTFSVNSSGQWTYTLNNASAAVQALAQGQSVTETYTVRVTDDKGAWDDQQVTVVINGTNDTPTITGDTTGAVIEAGNADPGAVIAGTTSTDPGALTAGTPTVSGTLTAHDPDAGATATWSGNAAGTYGSFAVNATTGVWTYTLDNSKPATNALAEGASATETFTVTVTDDKGATSTQDVSVTITGANDSPVISYAAGNAAGGVTEDGTLTTGGQLASADPDTGHTAAWSISPNSPQGTGTAYGTFSVNSSGQWTYTLNNASAAVQALAQGQSVTETYTVRVTDDKGAWDDQQVTVVINGTNDVPVVTNSHNWMSSDPSQQAATGHPDGYPLLVNIPTDPDGNNLTVTAASVPVGVYYFDGAAYHVVTSGMTLFQTGGINLLDDLVYRPTATANDTVNLNLSLNVSDGLVTTTENVGIHEVAPNRLPTDSSEVSNDGHPLTSGSSQTHDLTISQTTVNGIIADPHGSTVVVYTDFQNTPITTPIPASEQNPGTFNDGSTGSHREQEVQAEIVINGNHFVVVEADTTAAKFEQSWSYDSASGMMKATVNYDNILLNGTGQSLANYLIDHPPSAGDTWTLFYTDNAGGPYQARTLQFDFFTHDPGDPGITVTGDATLPDQIYGTSGHDVLSGGGGNDIIYGAGGDDLIIGGLGKDTMTGGAGADTFKLDHLDIKDLIADYHGGEGDKIDLSALFDTAPANSISNYVHYNSATSTVSVDTSGSGNAANFVDVAVLQNAPAAGTINILYDDSNHVQHTATI